MKHINYAIFQLREDIEDNILMQFSHYNLLKIMGIKPTIDRYQEICRGSIEVPEIFTDVWSLMGLLEEIFASGTLEDFKGHCLWISDVVELDLDGEKTFYYVDVMGYPELEGFDSTESKTQPKTESEVECTPYQKQTMNRFCRKE